MHRFMKKAKNNITPAKVEKFMTWVEKQKWFDRFTESKIMRKSGRFCISLKPEFWKGNSLFANPIVNKIIEKIQKLNHEIAWISGQNQYGSEDLYRLACCIFFKVVKKTGK